MAIVLQAAGHHEPAQGTHRSATDEDGHRAFQQPALQQAFPQEEGEGDDEDQSHEATPVAMQVFPEEDSLEARQVHVLVLQRVLRDLLVLGESLLPFGLIQRGKGTHDGLPLGDAEAAASEARDAADEHHARDEDTT